MRARLVALIAAGAAAALSAGCGDDNQAPIEPIGVSSTTTSTPTTSSKREFISSADARCAEANAAIANLSAATGSDSLALAAGQARQITQGVLDGLRALAQPADPSGALGRFYDALQAQVTVLKQREAAAASGDTATYDTLAGDLAQAKADALAAAGEFGLQQCGQEGSAASTTTTPPTSAGGVTVPVTPAPAPAPAPAPPPADTGGAGTGTPDTGTGGDGSSGGVSPG